MKELMNNGFLAPELLKDLTPQVAIAALVVGGVIEICKTCKLDIHIGPAN